MAKVDDHRVCPNFASKADAIEGVRDGELALIFIDCGKVEVGVGSAADLAKWCGLVDAGDRQDVCRVDRLDFLGRRRMRYFDSVVAGILGEASEFSAIVETRGLGVHGGQDKSGHSADSGLCWRSTVRARDASLEAPRE